MDVDSRWFGSEESARFKQMNSDIFQVETQARALGMDEVRRTLYRARIELGHEESRARREFTIKMRQRDEEAERGG